MTQMHSLTSQETLESEDHSRRRQVIASLLGAQSFEGIGWRRLLSDGACVRLRVGHRGFSTRLTLSDLGIQVDDERARTQVEKWMTLGSKRLLPATYDREFRKIAGRARYALRERAFRTELGLFVPVSAYERWRELAQGFQTEYYQLRDQLIENYRTVVQQVTSEYEDIARNNYQRLRQTHPDLVQESEEQFIAHYCNNIVSKIPPASRLASLFVFTFYPVGGLSQLGDVESETTSASRESALVEEEAVTLDEARGAIAERERQRALLESDIRTYARDRFTSTLDSFLSSIVGQLRSLTYQATCDVLETMKGRGGTLSPRSVLQLRNLLEQIRALNFYQDDDVERMMAQVESIVTLTPEQRQHSMADIQRTLRSIATVTRSTLLALEDEPRSARSIDIPEVPSETNVRQARAELGLDLDSGEFHSLFNYRNDVRSLRAEVAQMGMPSLWGETHPEPMRQVREL